MLLLLFRNVLILFVCQMFPVNSTASCFLFPEHADCRSWFDAGSTTSGPYNIGINSHIGMKEVYCDMEGDKGWLVSQFEKKTAVQRASLGQPLFTRPNQATTLNASIMSVPLSKLTKMLTIWKHALLIRLRYHRLIIWGRPLLILFQGFPKAPRWLCELYSDMARVQRRLW